MSTLKNEQNIFLKNSKISDFSQAKLRTIYNMFQGRFEYMEEASKGEATLLRKLDEGEARHFQLYVCRMNDEQKIQKLEAKANILQKEYPILRTGYYDYEGTKIKFILKNRKYMVSIRDITSRTKEEQKKTINNFIFSERKKKYNPYKMFPVNITIFKQEDGFICFMSLCELQECKKLKANILGALFGDSEYEKLETGINIERKGRIQSSLYWKERLGDLPSGVSSVLKYSDIGIGTEIKDLNDKITQSLQNYAKKNQVKLKTVLLMCWGVILHKYYETADIIMGDVSEGGRMGVLPIRLAGGGDVSERLHQIEEQMNQALMHDAFSLNEMEAEIDISFVECIPVIQNFCELEAENNFVEQIREKRVYQIYKISSYELPQVPLFLDYSMDEDRLRLSYSYDRRVYNNNDISLLHETFLRLAEGIMNHMREAVVVSAVSEMKKQSVIFDAEAVIREKISFMEEFPMFGGYAEKELQELAKKCRVIDYRIGDMIIAGQMPTESLYLIMEGMMEVSRLDSENYLRPLQILKKDAVFGIESLLKNNLCENSYIAYSDTVKLLEIPGTVLAEECRSRYEVIQELLEIQSRHLSKFQTLWTMD